MDLGLRHLKYKANYGWCRRAPGWSVGNRNGRVAESLESDLKKSTMLNSRGGVLRDRTNALADLRRRDGHYVVNDYVRPKREGKFS